MVESEFRGSANRHHGRHHRNTRRDVNSEGVNSHVPEPTRTDDDHNQHKEEKAHKERKTKMTKRTARILTGFAVLFMLISTASVRGFGAESRGFTFDKNVTNFRARNFEANDLRFRDRELRSTDKSVRLGNWKGEIFERVVRSRFGFRNEVRNAGSSLYKTNFRIRDNRAQDKVYNQKGFSLSNSSVNRPGKEIRNQSRAYGDYSFRSARRVRSLSGLNFDTDLEYRFNSFIA
jgi:hypothetical protein